ncbi:MAG: AlbA family DNA-binding domain-containing protein, partial [Terriglobales bacterium]
MSHAVESINSDQAAIVEQISEGQFSEVKAKEIAPGKLGKTLSAFANSDGGDLYIGVAEDQLGGGVRSRAWRGFADVEAANGHLQAFEPLFPLGAGFRYTFLKCNEKPGLVLHVQATRTQSIMKASDGIPYVRRGAQNLPVTMPDALRRLEYGKGITSFENEVVAVSKDVVTASPIMKMFLQYVVPSAEPEAWLTKQRLIRDNLPSVAGLLLFAEEPQATLPKRCGVKIYRYKTREAEGFRDVLAENPLTIEGCLYDQIKEAVKATIAITESIP